MTGATLVTAFGMLAILVCCGFLYARRGRYAYPLPQVLALGHLVGASVLGVAVTTSLALTDQVRFEAGLLTLLAAAFVGVRFGSAGGKCEMRNGECGMSEPRTRTGSPIPAGSPIPHSALRIPHLPEGPEWILLCLLFAGVLTVLARVLLLPLDWDGWATWQFKAHALTLGTLRDQLTAPEYGYSHPNYPLLVPAQTWWLCRAGFQPKLAQLSGFVFFLDLLVLFYYEARRHVPRLWALAGCVTLVSWPLVAKHAASGFADLPLAVYALAAIALLARRDLWLGVPLVAGALLTKNEGVFTFAAALAVVLLPMPRHPRAEGEALPASRWLPALALVGAAALSFGVWGVLKRRWHIAADMLDAGFWQADALAQLPGRVGVVARGFLSEFLAFGPRYPGWGLFWPLAALGLAVSMRRHLRVTAPFWMLGAVHLAGAFAAYLVTPLNPALHLSRSLDRLLLHAAPALLLATLLVLGGSREPGEGDPPANVRNGDSPGPDSAV